MTVLLSREVVKTVGEMQGLGIAESLTKFLDTAVDITEVKVDFLDGFTVDGCAESASAAA